MKLPEAKPLSLTLRSTHCCVAPAMGCHSNFTEAALATQVWLRTACRAGAADACCGVRKASRDRRMAARTRRDRGHLYLNRGRALIRLVTREASCIRWRTG